MVCFQEVGVFKYKSSKMELRASKWQSAMMALGFGSHSTKSRLAQVDAVHLGPITAWCCCHGNCIGST